MKTFTYMIEFMHYLDRILLVKYICRVDDQDIIRNKQLET